MICLNVTNFLYTNDNSLLGCLKCKKHAIFSTFSKNPIILGFGLFFTQKWVFRKYCKDTGFSGADGCQTNRAEK
jgi:hypothetical protein